MALTLNHKKVDQQLFLSTYFQFKLCHELKFIQ